MFFCFPDNSEVKWNDYWNSNLCKRISATRSNIAIIFGFVDSFLQFQLWNIWQMMWFKFVRLLNVLQSEAGHQLNINDQDDTDIGYFDMQKLTHFAYNGSGTLQGMKVY